MADKLRTLVLAFLMGSYAAVVIAQDEKPAPKRTPARPITKPADESAKQPPKDAPAKDMPRPKSPAATTTAEANSLPTQATIEMILNEAVNNIAKRYNLNEAQKQKTDEIMKRDVNKFLKEHEAQVWPIIRELMANGFQPPSDPEDVKRIGKAAAPLIKDVQKAILDGNNEWRQYLTPEQQKMHDFDLNEMDKQFVEAEKSFKSWAEGKAAGSPFPSPTPTDLGPPRPPKPPEGLLPKQRLAAAQPQPEPEEQVFRETAFDAYVEDFIKQYELDAGQIDTARSILAEFKQKASAYKDSNREEFSRVATEQKSAMDSKDRERIAKWETDRKKLLEPVYVLFGEMDERLKALLTSSQRDRFASRQPAMPKLDALNGARPTPAPQAAVPPTSTPPARAADKSSVGNAQTKPQTPPTTP